MGQLDTEHAPLEVQILGREVVLLGRRFAIALSAAAAAETARRLAEAATMATSADVVPIQGRELPPTTSQASQTLSRDE